MDTGTGSGPDRAQHWIALGLLAALVLLAGGWVLLVSPDKAEAELLREQAEVQVAANEQTERHLEVLRSKAEQLPERRGDLDRVSVRIPDEQALPDLLRALTVAAASAGVELVSVVPGTAVAVGAPPAPAAAAGATTAPGPAPAGALQAIPLTIKVTGGFYDVEVFVAVLEDLPRALRLTDVALAGGESPTAPRGSAPGEGPALTATVTGAVFMAAPAAAGTAPATAPAAGAPAVAGQPSETTS